MVFCLYSQIDAKGEARYCDLEKRILLGIFKSINGFEKNKNDSINDFYGKVSTHGKKEIYFYYKPVMLSHFSLFFACSIR